MNFFEYQDRARQNTQILIGLFALSVACIIVAVYGAVLLGLGASSLGPGSLWNPQLFFIVTFCTLLLIGGGSLYKLVTLGQGGSTIAQELGGRLVLPETTDPAERQLLNVVEEMAIASGISVPSVYVMDHERGINAFAAGFSPNNAVIGVTRGTLEQLNRDELQGVIGHEFSHILNGDMRLNLRLIGVLHGILLLYLIGRILLQTRDSSRNEKGGSLVLAGLALVVTGGIGLFFGRLIKSAVSRQREFLADASAVQFTRNPQGIAGALQKIAGHHSASLVYSPYAEQNSHMFFGSALRFNFLGDLYATHPPLEKRIARLKRFAGEHSSQPLPSSGGVPLAGESAHGGNPELPIAGFAGGSTRSPRPSTIQVKTTPDQVVNQVGTVTPNHFAYARSFLAQLPEDVRNGLRDRPGAVTVVYALSLDPENRPVRTKQVEWLRQVEAPDLVERTLQLVTQVDGLDPSFRLPLLELTIPALRQSTVEECQRLFKCLQGLAKADGRWSLAEFTLFTILWYRLQPCLNPKAERAVQHTNLGQIWSDCLLVLSALARVGQTQPDQVAFAFRSGVYRLPGAGQQNLPETPPPCSFNDLRQSLDRLSVTAPKLKQAIVDACAHTVLLDNTVTLQEADLLRAIVMTLDCPLPPFLNRTVKAK